MVFHCPIATCSGTFTVKENLLRHLMNHHGNLWSCQRCQQSFNRYDNYIMHDRTCYYKTTGKRHAEDDGYTVNKKLKDNLIYTGGALENTLADYRLVLTDEEQNANNIFAILKDSVSQLRGRVNEELKKKRALKFYLSLHLNFHLGSDETYITEPPVVLNTSAVELYESSQLDEILEKEYSNLVSAIEQFQGRGSGWVLDKLLMLDLHVFEFSPLRATSYIRLPK